MRNNDSTRNTDILGNDDIKGESYILVVNHLLFSTQLDRGTESIVLKPCPVYQRNQGAGGNSSCRINGASPKCVVLILKRKRITGGREVSGRQAGMQADGGREVEREKPGKHAGRVRQGGREADTRQTCKHAGRVRQGDRERQETGKHAGRQRDRVRQ